VDGQVAHPGVAPQPEQQAEDADEQAGEQDLMTGEAEEIALVQVGEADVHLAAGAVLGLRGLLGSHEGHGRRGEQPEHQQQQRKGTERRGQLHRRISPGLHG
jgi:hypothetical protein